jgi:hypothetical protein
VVEILIEPSYKSDIKEHIKLRKFFRKVGLVLESVSKIFVGTSSVVSFSAGIYNNKTLSFLGGVFSTCSLVLLQFALYSYKESKRETVVLNDILRQLNIETVPVMKDSNSSTSETPVVSEQLDNHNHQRHSFRVNT